MNPKETSLMTHPDESMKMYDINERKKKQYKKKDLSADFHNLENVRKEDQINVATGLILAC